MADIPIEELIAEVQRETAIRRSVYPSWVGKKKMTQAEADRRIANMEAVANTLEALKRGSTTNG